MKEIPVLSFHSQDKKKFNHKTGENKVVTYTDRKKLNQTSLYESNIVAWRLIKQQKNEEQRKWRELN